MRVAKRVCVCARAVEKWPRESRTIWWELSNFLVVSVRSYNLLLLAKVASPFFLPSMACLRFFQIEFHIFTFSNYGHKFFFRKNKNVEHFLSCCVSAELVYLYMDSFKIFVWIID